MIYPQYLLNMYVLDCLEVPDPLYTDLKWAGICGMDCTVDLSVLICGNFTYLTMKRTLPRQIINAFYNFLLFCNQGLQLQYHGWKCIMGPHIFAFAVSFTPRA